jgi:hypothetical protein
MNSKYICVSSKSKLAHAPEPVRQSYWGGMDIQSAISAHASSQDSLVDKDMVSVYGQLPVALSFMLPSYIFSAGLNSVEYPGLSITGHRAPQTFSLDLYEVLPSNMPSNSNRVVKQIITSIIEQYCAYMDIPMSPPNISDSFRRYVKIDKPLMIVYLKNRYEKYIKCGLLV